MDLSLFLAKVMGVYMLVLGIVILKRPDLGKALNNISEDEGLRFVIGLFTLILGLVLVNAHNIWVGGYRVLITIIAWIALIKGLLTVILPEKKFKELVKKANTPQMLKLAGIINLVVGIYLTYVGYLS